MYRYERDKENKTKKGSCTPTHHQNNRREIRRETELIEILNKSQPSEEIINHYE